MSSEHRNRDELARRIADRLSVPLERVERMLARNKQLHDVCDEFETCRAAAERWRSVESTGRDRIEEFEALADELEAEITRLLAGHREDSP